MFARLLKSIVFKYFTVTAVMVVICFTFLGTALLVMTANYSVGEQQKQLLRDAQGLSGITAKMSSTPFSLYSQTDNETARREFDIYRELMASFGEGGTRDIIIVKAGSGDCLWFKRDGSITAETGLVSTQVIDLLASAGQDGFYRSSGDFCGLFDENRYTIGVPIVVAHGPVQADSGNTFVPGYLFISSPSTSLTAMLAVVSRFYFVSVCGVLILSFIMVYAGTRSLTRPITEMRDALSEYAHGDFSRRIRVKGDDEIADLCISFNNMADSLEQLEISRRGFMANVSHDLKTPMTTVSGFIDGILDGTIDPSRQKGYLARVSQEMKRLSRLVNSIMDITRLEGGQVKLEKTRFDINEIIKRVLLSFEIVIEEKAFELSFNLDEKIYVYADEDSVYRVLTNIIGNSVKYTPQAGLISVSTYSDAGKTVVIKIRNTGPGISPEEIPFIFDRFYKSDKSRGLDREGMGLGLYIAKMLVNFNDGEIGVQSTPNAFTEFYFTLPQYREGKTER